MEQTDKKQNQEKKISAVGYKNLRNSKGQTILHVAAAANHIDMIRLMVNMKVDPNQQCTTQERTALHMAAEKGHDMAAKLLIEAGSSVNKQDVAGNTPLHLAVLGQHEVIVKILLKFGADPQTKNVKQQTSIQLSKNSQITSLLKEA